MTWESSDGVMTMMNFTFNWYTFGYAVYGMMFVIGLAFSVAALLVWIEDDYKPNELWLFILLGVVTAMSSSVAINDIYERQTQETQVVCTMTHSDHYFSFTCRK